MEPNAFDATAGVALLVLMPSSVLFVAAALRRLGIPRWSWSLYLLAVAGVLVLLHQPDAVRYPVDDPDPWSDWYQFIGLGLGRIGVGVNAVAAAVWIAVRRKGYHERLPRRETRLVAAAYGVMAIATALPATWWAIGLGVVPLLAELPLVVTAAAVLTWSLVLRARRLRSAAEDDRPSIETTWPADSVVAVWLVGALAVGPLFAGSGRPDASLVPQPDAAVTATPRSTPDPEWPGPTPVTTTTLDGAAVESGTRSLLEDTVRWAGPLDDLSSPTPASAEPPPVVLTEQRCDAGRRWSGSLVLPTVRPQDLAPRVRSGWESAGYAAVDRAMGTDLVMPVRDDAAVERMRLGGGADGVHVTVESFCVPA
ncbi:hypothetical protein ACRQ4B_02420 [Curtobacterium sp. SP.BCo]|uniref:hypothetical protein n=1 Tax=Curtobacterium sp. SP.BCo TaxID=3435229 RepID=UPI003F73F965